MRLEMAGCEVSEALDGAKGVDLARRKNPSLIFLDWSMPLMDGWQVCRILKEDPTTRHIPIVIVTGLSEPLSPYGDIKNLADGFIQKPWEISDITAALERFLPSVKGVRYGR